MGSGQLVVRGGVGERGRDSDSMYANGHTKWHIRTYM